MSYIPGTPGFAENDHDRPRYPGLDGATTDTGFDLDGILEALKPQPEPERKPVQAATTSERSSNVLRPLTFDSIIGQDRVKALLARMVQVCRDRERPLDHVLLVGPSGTGKTTFAHVIAHEIGARVYQVEAPISADTLLELADTMEDGDILFIDEIHQQSVGDRRGRSSNTQPEVLFGVMEDRTLATGSGIVPFPHVTIMGATTDEGMLPDAFINRFPIRPRLVRYSEEDMAQIARANASTLGLKLTPSAACRFARASRGVPREINNFIRNGAMLSWTIDDTVATEVLQDLNGVTDDGLTRDMQAMLVFLYTRAKRTSADGEVRYQASISSIATAIGKSRDQKAVQLRVEPWLIERGLVQVAHGGRVLTDEGIMRAHVLYMTGD